MSAHTSFGPRDRWGLRQNRLWILAAVLAVLSFHGMAGLIHDNSRRHVAATLVRRATAERIVAYASSRATILGLEALAPAFVPTRSGEGREVVAELARRHAVAVRCACRDTLPATAFFRVDLRTNQVDFARLPAASLSPPPLEVLAEVARQHAATASRPVVRVTTSRALGDGTAVTYVQLDSAASPRVVVGLIAPTRDLGEVLFKSAADSTRVEVEGARLVVLDDTSLFVTDAAGSPVFGAADTSGRLRAAIQAGGSLDGFTIMLGLSGLQFHPSVLNVVPRQQLWHNGLLITATFLVTMFAVGSARREIMLARARSDFVAGISHDLRMPLAQILLASETMVKHREAPAAERLNLATAIVRESRRLISLVENILLYTRTGSVELRARLEPVRVDELFADVVEAVELAVEDAGQSVDARPSHSISVLADRQLVRQALVNLVDNALKYGKPGQRVELLVERISATMVRLHVDDEGPGIPRAERERVFEPYERLGRDQMSERTGTGLGLSVVRQIVKACGGRVWLDDRAGGGTRATIELASAEVTSPVATAGAPV